MSCQDNLIVDESSHLPCPWANRSLSGHFHKFPAELEKAYDDLRKKKVIIVIFKFNIRILKFKKFQIIYHVLFNLVSILVS